MTRLLKVSMVGAILLVGCDSLESQKLSQQAIELRQALFVDSAPANIQSIKSVYADFQPDQVVTIAGRIYAQEISPFDPNEASFSVIELPKPGHNHDDPGDCPFCLRELRNAKFAIVKVVDAAGHTINEPADQLLGLKKNDDVAVTGLATQVGDTIIVQLEKLHRLSGEESKSLAKQFRK